ncbi:unnamed protein product [Ostreobium quekettii]|uniref:Vanadium-dependent haloperoxidase NapH1-like second helical-bundle domain-containing protein n=1 Tax=Ostreobium quekettii TaxID=121088 RepID=A0A8S1JI25_9CHLO|nr:unnamed protein product [Ostreobium quekettii]
MRNNFDSLPPPAMGRILGIFTTCIHDGAAQLNPTMKPAYATERRGTEGLNVVAVVDGAAFHALQKMFSGFTTIDAVRQRMNALYGESMRFGDPGPSGLFFATTDDPSFNLGMEVCQEVVATFESDGYDAIGHPNGGAIEYTEHEPVNDDQEEPGFTNCGSEIHDLDHWQPLCVPVENGSSVCEVQSMLSPNAGRWTTFVYDGQESLKLPGPPSYYGDHDEYIRQAREVAEFSANMTDVGKVLAEHWADGPDTTAPGGHWYRIAMEAAKNLGLGLYDTAKLLFLMGISQNDAGVAAWESKRHFDFARPITMIQCGLGDETLESWLGPYLGLGTLPASRWQPYQATTFVTPAFQGYVSGHSTFSGAGAGAMNRFVGEEYVAPKCRRIEEGGSLFEGRVREGEPGYVEGMTDVPNNGPYSIGYAPATDVVLCWETWDEAAEESGISRLHGGIHIIADHIDGKAMGLKLADLVYEKAIQLWT